MRTFAYQVALERAKTMIEAIEGLRKNSDTRIILVKDLGKQILLIVESKWLHPWEIEMLKELERVYS